MRKKALIYCRVSTEEQAKEGYSLNAQENFCRKFAENNEYYIDGACMDNYPISLFNDRLDETLGFYICSSSSKITNNLIEKKLEVKQELVFEK